MNKIVCHLWRAEPLTSDLHTWDIDVEEETVLGAHDGQAIPAELFTLDVGVSRHVVHRLLGLVGHR